MSTNMKIIAVVIVAVLAGASFWGGMAYGKSHAFAKFAGGQGGFGNVQFQNGGARGRAGGGAQTGQIISADASSMTLKLQNGSTQIVVLSGSTQISKSVPGSVSDLAPGTDVVVVGQTNSDGSITAQSVQMRPVITK